MVFAYPVTLRLRRAEDVQTFIAGFAPLLTFCNRREHGTLTYELHRHETCDRTLLVLERYSSPGDLETHRQSQAFKDFGAFLTSQNIIESKTNERYHTDLLASSFASLEGDFHINGCDPSPANAGPSLTRQRVLVFCGSRMGANAAYEAQAKALGELLGRRRAVLVYSGGTVGVMGAVAHAALRAGAGIHSVIPAAMLPRECSGDLVGDEVTVTRTMAERKEMLRSGAQVVIALPGGVGTFDELLEVLTLFQLGAARPKIGLLDVGGFFQPFLLLLRHLVSQGFAEETVCESFVTATTAEELLRRLDEFVVPLDMPQPLNWNAKPAANGV
jgi:uncharacterized protein (TIGR00730 family)